MLWRVRTEAVLTLSQNHVKTQQLEGQADDLSVGSVTQTQISTLLARVLKTWDHQDARQIRFIVHLSPLLTQQTLPSECSPSPAPTGETRKTRSGKSSQR